MEDSCIKTSHSSGCKKFGKYTRKDDLIIRGLPREEKLYEIFKTVAKTPEVPTENHEICTIHWLPSRNSTIIARLNNSDKKMLWSEP